MRNTAGLHGLYSSVGAILVHRRRALIPLAVVISIIFIIRPLLIPYNHVYNYWVAQTGHPSIIPRPGRVPWGGLGTPPLVKELLCSPWPGHVPAPQLTRPYYDKKDHRLLSPALLMLHIPSINSPNARRRRELIRFVNPMESIPREYRHLVDVKFVLGRPNGSEARQPEVQEEEREISIEQDRYGDIIRLEGLEGGENMDNGKTLEWLRWVGAGERHAQWIVKCDDDVFPILPNLLSLLLERNASVPTYFGSHSGAFMGTHYHFEGMMYGFNWGVVNTLSNAEFPRSEIIKFFPEDGRSGELMYSLPSAPHCPPLDLCQHSTSLSHSFNRSITPRRLPPYPPTKRPPKHPKLPSSDHECDPLTPPGGRTWDHHPPNPDPRTGLFRWDLGAKMGRWQHWWVAKPETAVAYHYMKQNSDYLDVYERTVERFEEIGREFMWKPPKEFEAYAEPLNP